MSLHVRKYREEDTQAFRTLHRDCLAHYAIRAATQSEEDRVLALLSSERHMACHLAFLDGEAAGFATWGLSFPAGPGISLVMKELFVAEHGRGHGVGKALLSALVDVARDEGCERLDWATDGTNTAALAFYKSIGASPHAKQAYRVRRDEFRELQKRL